MSTGFVILSGGTPWYQSGNSDKIPLSQVGHRRERKVPVKTRAAAKGDTQIKFPLFEKAAALCDDEYWRTILMDMSRGKFVRGYRYSDNNLILKVRSKVYEHHIPDDPEEALREVILFMQTRGKMFSKRDADHNNRLRAANLKPLELNSWSQIRSGSHRSVVINRYISDISNEHRLNLTQRRQLRYIVNLGIIIGYFNSSNIHVTDGFITMIEGIVMDHEGNFVLDPDYPFKVRKIAKSKRVSQPGNTLTLTNDEDNEDGYQTGYRNPSLAKIWIDKLTKAKRRTV